MHKKNNFLNNSYNYYRNNKKINSFLSKTENSSLKNTIYINKPKNIDFSEYFKINNKSENKIINNLNRYNIQNQNFFISKSINNENKIIFNRTFNFDKENGVKNSSENFYDIYNDLNDGNNDIKMIYNKTGNIIENDINDNINKMKKGEELVYLRNTLNKLKLQKKKIQNELNIMDNKNLKLKNNKTYINKRIYMDIKNIFIDNEKDIKSNNNRINFDDILNFYKINIGINSSFEEKIKILRGIYLNEKLKDSLVEKTNKLFLENNLLKEEESNKSNDTTNTDKIYNCVSNLLEKIDTIKRNNEELEQKINDKNKEKNLYNFYYNNWLYRLKIKNKEDLKNKIKDLILDQNYNDIEEIKLYNILMNKKES